MATTRRLSDSNTNSHSTPGADLNYLISPQLLKHYKTNIIPQCNQTTIRKRDFLPHYRARSYPLYINKSFVSLSPSSSSKTIRHQQTQNEHLIENKHSTQHPILSDYVLNEKVSSDFNAVTKAFSLIDPDDEQSVVGEGTYGVVFRAFSKPKGGDVAVKSIRCDDGYSYAFDLNETQTQTQKSGFMTHKLSLKKKKKQRQFIEQSGIPHTAIQELQTLQRLQHKNIVNLIDVVTNRTSFGCVPCNISSHRYYALLLQIWKDSYAEKYPHLSIDDAASAKDIFSEISPEDVLCLENDIRARLYAASEMHHTKNCRNGKTPIPVFYMISEYMDRDLLQLIKYNRENKLFLKEEVVKYYMTQIMEGLAHCHVCGIIHRDIKPSNVLINYSGEVKLCDFGLAFENYSTHSSTIKTNRVITSWYRPLEILFGDTQYSYAVDIWSTACLFVEMLTNL